MKKTTIYFDEEHLKRIDLKKNSTKIFDTHTYNDKEIVQLCLFVRAGRVCNGYTNKRTMLSMVQEVIAHRRLYKLGLFRKSTKDTDLEENLKWRHKIGYAILGWSYGLKWLKSYK